MTSIAFAGGSGHIYGYGKTQEQAIKMALEYVIEGDCIIKEIIMSLSKNNLDHKATASIYGCRVDEDDRP
jgi:hypothetical protein